MTDPRPLVAHVVYRFSVGGLENGVVNLINRLPTDRLRHAVVAMTDCDPVFVRRITRPDVQFFSLHKPPGQGVRLYPAFYRLCRQLRPAIVHTRNLAALELAVPAWAAGVRTRIHGEHGWDERDRGGENARFQRVRKAYAPWVNHYIALSGHIEHYLKHAIGIRPKRISRICNGVDSARFSPASEAPEPIPGNPFSGSGLRFLGTVGRLQAVKDQLTLVRAFARLKAQGGFPEWRLILAGDGPLRGEVDAEIARTGMTSEVWLAGERADVPTLLRGLDLFALPSQSEGISNTILEAMACGLAVVATQVGGNAELVVSGQTGVLIPANNPEALARALAAYMDDAPLRQTHGRAGRARIEDTFSLSAMVTRYLDVYEAYSHQDRQAHE